MNINTLFIYLLLFGMMSCKNTNTGNTETVASINDRLREEVAERLRPELDLLGLADLPDQVRFVGLKQERILETYVKKGKEWKLLKSYPFTAFSGVIGPKLREGDRQIPEGIYGFEYLNPNSSYYLSVKVSFPNAFDLEKGKKDGRSEVGSDIFIHGKAVTIGCIPIGDHAIEEVFVLISKAGINNCDIIIAPWDFRQNPEFPNISHVSWSDELYKNISQALREM